MFPLCLMVIPSAPDDKLASTPNLRLALASAEEFWIYAPPSLLKERKLLYKVALKPLVPSLSINRPSSLTAKVPPCQRLLSENDIFAVKGTVFPLPFKISLGHGVEHAIGVGDDELVGRGGGVLELAQAGGAVDVEFFCSNYIS